MPSRKQAGNTLNTKTKISEESEKERLLKDMHRPDMEKLHLFTQMLRINALYKKAKVTHNGCS